MVCFAPLLSLPVYLFANVGLQGLPATTLWGLRASAWPALLHNLPPCWVCQLPPCHESSPPRLPVSAPPTGLDECFFFNSFVVGLPYSSIFCHFWLFFVFKFVVVLLVVRGGTVCLPMPPSWPEVPHYFNYTNGFMDA